MKLGFHFHTGADVPNTLYILMVKPSDVPYVAHSHITILEYKRTPTPVLDDNLYNIASAGTEEGIVI